MSKYPPVREDQRSGVRPINPYHFIEKLFEQLAPDDVVACGDATATIVPFQAARIQRGQRVFSNSGSASMGYDLPASVGAAVARRGRRVICLAGDGSLQMNIQELATIRHHRLPVKLFVLDNGGYVSIRSTQENFFGATIGSGPDDGVSFPDYAAVAAAYGIPAVRLVEPAALDDTIADVLASDGPMVCHVLLDPKQGFEPRIKSRVMPDGTIVSPALDDMYPFLDPGELPRDMPGPAVAPTEGRQPPPSPSLGGLSAGGPECSTSTGRSSTPGRASARRSQRHSTRSPGEVRPARRST